jgi:hypothetical protein
VLVEKKARTAVGAKPAHNSVLLPLANCLLELPPIRPGKDVRFAACVLGGHLFKGIYRHDVPVVHLANAAQQHTADFDRAVNAVLAANQMADSTDDSEVQMHGNRMGSRRPHIRLTG